MLNQTVNTNSHLNLFNFYSGNEKDQENNITRALAICLNNNKMILKRFLEKVLLPGDYLDLFIFNFDGINDEEIIIDIQRKVSNISWFEGNINKIIGLTLTTREYDKEEIKMVQAAEKDEPIPDLLIAVKDIIVLFEIKIWDDKGSISQIKNQVNKLKESLEDEEQEVKTEIKSISWEKVLKSFMDVEDLHKTKDEDDIFVSDFNYFIKSNYPTWFPVLLLQEIDFSDEEDSPNYKQIMKRLNMIKMRTTIEHMDDKDDLTDKGNRSAIPLDFDWAKEANIYIEKEQEYNNQYLGIKVWPGDTKGQGRYIFREDNDLEWINNKKISGSEGEYDLEITPYIKFSNWNKGVAWIKPISVDNGEYKKTHSNESFKELAGRWKRDSDNKSWQKLSKLLDKTVERNWRKDVEWEDNFINSNRTTIDLSLGFEVEILIPYKNAQKLDDDKKSPKLTKEIYTILYCLKDIIDKNN